MMDVDIVYTAKLKMFESINVVNIIFTKLINIAMLPINIQIFFQEYIRSNIYPKKKIYML